jgi:hypothetical protein
LASGAYGVQGDHQKKVSVLRGRALLLAGHWPLTTDRWGELSPLKTEGDQHAHVFWFARSPDHPILDGKAFKVIIHSGNWNRKLETRLRFLLATDHWPLVLSKSPACAPPGKSPAAERLFWPTAGDQEPKTGYIVYNDT